MGTITIDTNVLQKLQSSPKALSDDPPTEDDIRNDPKSVLSRFGVEIDDEMNEAFKQKLAAKGAVQAGTLHIDI